MSFTVYRSSAGSGKTFTLVKEYLKIALQDTQRPPIQYKKILAITFTNKAAAEMKERVIKALKELSSGNSTSPLLELLKEETKLSAEILQLRATEILQSILHNYSDFAIGTIDSFVHRIVRTFAFDLKLPVAFDIELDDNALLQQAIELLLNKIGSDKKLTKLLVDFTESKTDDEKSWHIEKDLAEFSKNLLKDENSSYLQNLKKLTIDDFSAVKKRIEKQIDDYENSVKKLATEAFELITKNNLTPTAFFQGDRGIYDFFKKLSTGDYNKDANSYVTATINENKWTSGKVSKEDKAVIENIKDTLTEKYNAIKQYTEIEKKNYILHTLIYKNIYPLAVLNEIEKVLEEYKKENSILHISEFNNIISKIVLNQPIPFIYERLGEKYINYLIDEFQDTSVLQWQNLLPLIDNSLATSNFNMIVGDGKQAIYRWRGGEVEQFSRLPEIISHKDNALVREREATLKRNYEAKQLSNNFRSKHEVVQFNNQFFNSISQRLDSGLKNIYDSQEQNSNPNNTGGFISVDFIEGEKQEREEQNKQKIIDTITTLRSDGFELKDIAVICRFNKQGNLIANHLSQNNIPVVSSESLLLKSSRSVNFMMAAFNYIKDESDKIAQATILAFLINEGKIREEKISLYITVIGIGSFSLVAILKKEGFNFDRNILSRLMIYEAAEEITRIFGLNTKDKIDVQFFLEEVFKYVSKYNNSLHDFIEWWNNEKNQPSLVVPQEVNAVKIITIHKSKGLEYPAVIFPFADWNIKKEKDNIWVDLEDNTIGLGSTILPMQNKLNETIYADKFKEEENKSLLDSINLLYVAMTRAEERMYILTGGLKSKASDKFNSTTDIFNFYFDTTQNKQNGTTHYEFGARIKHVTRKKSNSGMYELKDINSNNWEKRISIRKSSWGKGLEEETTARLRGTFYHLALEKVGTKNDINDVVNKLYLEGLLNNEEKAEMTNKINSLLSQSDIKKLFETDHEVKTESEIILPGGATYRPDRVLIKNNYAIIVDFKTGITNKDHEKQLSDYQEALIKMGYSNVEKYLLYIDAEKLEKLP